MSEQEGPQKEKKEEAPPVVKVPDHIVQKAMLDLEGKHKGIPGQDVIEGDKTYTSDDQAAGLALFGGGKLFRGGEVIDSSELKPISEPQPKAQKKSPQPKGTTQENPKPDIA